MKYQCPCCGYYTFDSKPNGNYDICPVCFWEDDTIDDITSIGGANRVSLQQARLNFKKFGACEKNMIPYVRNPNMDEMDTKKL
ncbi:CPCC family cysteine-rich protein [Lachnospiraceae bacterium 46-61]